MKKIFLMLLLTTLAYSQNADIDNNITEALQQIDAGNIQKAEAILSKLISKYPTEPSVIFLDAVLTKKGDEALKKYFLLYKKYPQTKYADAALYRIFSYYYALGYYKNANNYLNKLKTEYPNSPYIKNALRNIPLEEQTKDTTQEKKEIVIYKYTVQAGAFLNFDNAKNLGEQLNSEGYDTEIITKEIGGSIFNIVNVGKFVNEEDAKPLLGFLEKKYNIKGRTVSIN